MKATLKYPETYILPELTRQIEKPLIRLKHCKSGSNLNKYKGSKK